MTDRPAERTASRPRADRVRRHGNADPPLTERIQAKLSNAADEHRANANAESKPGDRASGAAPPGSVRRAGPGSG